jgi:hypothetical protein
VCVGQRESHHHSLRVAALTQGAGRGRGEGGEHRGRVALEQLYGARHQAHFRRGVFSGDVQHGAGARAPRFARGRAHRSGAGGGVRVSARGASEADNRWDFLVLAAAALGVPRFAAQGRGPLPHHSLPKRSAANV